MTETGARIAMITGGDPKAKLCVRVPIDASRWVEDLPPAPGTEAITVSFSSAFLARRDGPAIAALGYRDVGASGESSGEHHAYVMVPWALTRRHQRWWRALLEAADRVYDLRFGPVQQLLAAVIAAHATVRDGHRTRDASSRMLRRRGLPHPSS